MLRISFFFGISIYMFFTDHPYPHFHAYYGEYGAIINIQTLEVMEGKLPPRALRLVREWAELRRDELMQDWELARQREPLLKIEPLE
jgi:hypothetical protein